MKQDKKWLLREFRKLSFEFQNGYLKVKAVDVVPLIEQLDEPEVLSQEWIYEHRESSFDLDEDSETVFINVEKLQNKLVPKQELPVIPQFVADWWERDDDSVTMYEGVRIEKKHKFDLVSHFQDRGLIDSLSKVEVWIDENESTFLDLVNGKPYEIEKEKLYYVQLIEGKSYLCKEPFGELWFNSAGLLLEPSYTGKMRFTEKEIKDYDERFMAFAVEVAE